MIELIKHVSLNIKTNNDHSLQISSTVSVISPSFPFSGSQAPRETGVFGYFLEVLYHQYTMTY